jgi:hypothetical protein
MCFLCDFMVKGQVPASIYHGIKNIQAELIKKNNKKAAPLRAQLSLLLPAPPIWPRGGVTAVASKILSNPDTPPRIDSYWLTASAAGYISRYLRCGQCLRAGRCQPCAK